MTIFSHLNLTIDEQEIFCSLNLQAGTQLQKDKEDIAGHLKTLFEFGSKEVAYDAHKAVKYHHIANSTRDPAADAGHDWLTALRLFLTRAKTTENVYEAHRWFTSIRLALVRSNRVAGSAGSAFLPGLFSIGGFSYGLSLLFDIGVVLYSTFRPALSQEEKDLPFRQRSWRRFKNVMQKDDRLSRMANDALFFAINLSVFILTGGVSAILNILGGAFDVVLALVRGIIAYKTIDNFIFKINDAIKQLGQEKTGENEKTINSLMLVKTQLKEKRHAVFMNHLRIVAGATLSLFGIALVLFPPTMVAGALLIGSGAALFGGSVITGLGRRLYEHACPLGNKLLNKINTWLRPPPEIALPKLDDAVQNQPPVPLEMPPVSGPIPVPIRPANDITHAPSYALTAVSTATLRFFTPSSSPRPTQEETAPLTYVHRQYGG